MKRSISVFIICVMGLLGIIPVAAETVMVYVEEEGPGVPGNDALYFLSAVEDGIMDAFFDAGYIIFNANPPRVAYEAAEETDAEVLDIALQGGAQLVLRVKIQLENRNGNSVRAVSHRYSVQRIGSPQEVARDAGSAPRLIGESDNGIQAGFRLGRAIAERVLLQL